MDCSRRKSIYLSDGAVIRLFFGNDTEEPLPSLTGYPAARDTKGNKGGVKAERRFIRVVPKGDFIVIDITTELVARLFRLDNDGDLG